MTIYAVPGRGRVPIPAGHPDDDAVDARDAIAVLPGLYPEWLGSQSFCKVNAVRFPYVVGEMARGIATAEMVETAVRSGFMAFFGSAGLPLSDIQVALQRLQQSLGSNAAWGANLIHSPDDVDQERATVDLFLQAGVRRISASAFMGLSEDVVRFSAGGLANDPNGGVIRHRHVFAKVSHATVAAAFMAPPPDDYLQNLVVKGAITKQQAELQSKLPVATAVTAEADSGGHTDNRPLNTLFPSLAKLRYEIQEEHRYSDPPFLGAAGGLGSPAAVASAFALGADYVVTGSINQSALQSGLSESGRSMLAAASVNDMTMAPAADMFERGVKVQVLSRGTLFAVKAAKLYDIYKRHSDFPALSEKERAYVENNVLGCSFEQAWSETRAWLVDNNPALAAKGDKDGRQRMASVFRRYLFQGSQWARDGVVENATDYQIWSGPALGSFNEWVKDSPLEPLSGRCVAQIGLNLLEGAATMVRANQLRSLGVSVDPAQISFEPRHLAAAPL